MEAELQGFDEIARRTLALSRIPPAAPPADGFNACIERSKKFVHRRVPLNVPLPPPIGAPASTINSLIASGSASPGGDQYSITSAAPDQPVALSYSRVYRGRDSHGVMSEAVVSYLVDTSPGSSDPIELEVNAELRQDGKLVGTIEETGSVSASCDGKWRTFASTSIKYHGKRAEMDRKSWSLDGGLRVDHRSFDKALLDARATLDGYWDQGSFPAHKSLTTFGGFDDPEIRTEIERIPGKSRRWDPLLGRKAEFRLYRLRHFEGRHLTEEELLAQSSASPYGLTATAAPGDPSPVYEEDASRSVWEKTRLTPVVARPRLQADKFPLSDWTAPALEMRLQLDHEMVFDGASRYGTLTRLPDTDGHPRYDFVSRFVTPSPEPAPIDRRRYTRETPFLDYRNPRVAALVRSIRDRHLTNPRELAQAILDKVHEVIPSYDYMIYDDIQSARMLSASQIVERGIGICQHFSALYVALARGLGLPARIETGIELGMDNPRATTLSPDFHAWVEISLDGRSWTPLDPEDPGTPEIHRRGYIPFGEYLAYDDPPGTNPRASDPLNDPGFYLKVRRVGTRD